MMKLPLGLLPIVFCLMLPAVAFAGPISDVVGAVGDTASAIGDSVGNTVDTVRGKRTPEIVRSEIDTEERKALNRLFRETPAARRLFDKSYGYAVFDSSKKGFLLSSASGIGVAVRKNDNKRSYMRMASLGANIGGGIQFFQVVFLFENQAAYNSFVNSGWEAQGEADAVIGKNSVEADIQFVSGKAIFQLNDTGLMLGANISGTKYWKDSTLNKKS